MRTNRLPFCVIFPLFSVCVWILFVAIPVTFGYLHIMYASHGSPSVSINTGEFQLSIASRNFLRFAAYNLGERSCRALVALNLPALPFELLTSIKTWPRIWSPAGLPLLRWRAMIYPLLALPVWLYVGTGIDALLGRVRLHIWDIVISSIVALAFAAGCGALTFAVPPVDQDPSLTSVGGGLGLWALLFAVMAFACVKQYTPKAMPAMRVAFGLTLGVFVLWCWVYSRLPLWEVRSPAGSYLINSRSGIVTLGVVIATQFLSWAIFRKFKNETSGSLSGENAV